MKMGILVLVLALFLLQGPSTQKEWPQYSSNPFVIVMDIPKEDEGIGGIIVADVDGDGLMDYLVTKPSYLAVYNHSGKKLWIKEMDIQVTGSAESQGLPGWHGPGVQVGDVDGDGKMEVLFLTKSGQLFICEGKTGRVKRTLSFPVPKGAERWELVVIANLRGKGDRDIILQATNKSGYRMGRYVAAYALEKNRETSLLWQTDNYLGCAHNGLRIADIDGDRKDEVLGVTIIDDDGRIIQHFPYEGHMDSIFVNDVLPKSKGLEIVTLQEGAGNHVFLFSKEKFFWKFPAGEQEAQNAAVGEFDLGREGLEIWCRSRYDVHQKPFVLDANGNLINRYEMDDVAPKGWTEKGVEEIFTIDWTGEKKQLACAKERHKPGDVCIFDPVSGKFLVHIKEKADRLYVADVAGDWREEIIVVSGNEIHIYHNEAPNPNPKHPRLWTIQHYKRSKMTWNYYSP